MASIQELRNKYLNTSQSAETSQNTTIDELRAKYAPKTTKTPVAPQLSAPRPKVSREQREADRAAPKDTRVFLPTKNTFSTDFSRTPKVDLSGLPTVAPTKKPELTGVMDRLYTPPIRGNVNSPKGVGENIVTGGLTDAGMRLVNTMDFINQPVNKAFEAAGMKTGSTRVREFFNASKALLEEDYETATKDLNPVQRTLATGVRGTIASVPEMAIAAFLSPATAATKAVGIAAKLRAFASRLVSNPATYSNLIQTMSNSFYDAKQKGNSDLISYAYSVLNAVPAAAIEGMGGIEAPVGGGNAILNWLKTMFDESKEEVIQGAVEKAVQNLVLGEKNPVASLTDPNAIFSGSRAAQEAVGGAIGGGIFGVNQLMSGSRTATSSAQPTTTPQAVVQAPTEAAVSAFAPQTINDTAEIKAPQNTPQAAVQKAPANPESHIDNRSFDTVGKRSVNAFQFDNPQLHTYFQDAARGLLGDLQSSTRGERYAQTDSDGYLVQMKGVKRDTTEAIETLLDDANLSYAQIEKALNDLIQNHGQENYAAAKRVELVLDELLTNGGKDADGRPIPPNAEYVNAKSQIEGAKEVSEYAQGEEEYELPDFDLPTVRRNPSSLLATESVGAAPQGQNDYAIDPAFREAQGIVKETGRRAYQSLVSGQAPLERMAKAQRKINPTAVTVEDLTQQIRGAGGTVDYIAEKALVDKSGNAIGKAWKEVVGLSADELDTLNEYMQNKHNIARQAQKKPVLEATAEQSAARVAEMEAQNPNIAAKAQEVLQTWDTFMREWVVGGNLLSEEQYQTMKEMYPDYIPTFRQEKQTGKASSFVLGKTLGTAKTIKKAVGSTKPIVPIEESFMAQMNKFVRAERKNELFLSLVDFARSNPREASYFATLVAPDENLRTAYQEGFDGFVDTVDAQSMKEIKNGVYRVTAYENGEPVSLNVSKEMFDALSSLVGDDFGKLRGFVDTGRKATSVPKTLITGANPFFAVFNTFRDVQTGYVNSITNRKTFLTYTADLGKAVAEMAQGSKDWETYKALGGKRSGFYNIEKGFTKSLNNGKLATLGNNIKGGLSFLSENSEQIVRFAEYKNAIQKYGDTADGRKKAMQAAADVTVNFSRSGPVTKLLDSWVMYLNAGVQGVDKMARQVKANPLRTLRRGLEIAVLPTLLLWLINRNNPNYQDLDDRTKDTYFLIPNMADLDEYGNAKTFIKIPKSREYGVALGATAERAARVLDGESPEEAFDGLGTQIVEGFSPANIITDNALAAPFINLPANKDFAGRSIVPESMRNLEPKYQYDYSTSGIAKALGNAFNKSPKQIDYLIKSYTGVAGEFILPMTTGKPQSAGDAARQYLLAPLQKKFIANPLYQEGVTDKFYKALDKATTEAYTKNFVEDIPADAYTPEEKKRSELQKVATAISDLRKEERKLMGMPMTEAQRKPMIEKLRRQAIELARTAEQNAERTAEQYRSGYVQEISHLSEKMQQSAKEGKRLGISYDAFVKHTDAINDIKGDPDENGKTVNGSRQKNVFAYIDSLKLSEKQKDYLKAIEYPSYKAD